MSRAPEIGLILADTTAAPQDQGPLVFAGPDGRAVERHDYCYSLLSKLPTGILAFSIVAVVAIIAKGHDINAVYSGGNTPLIYMQSSRNTKMAKAFIERGADVNAKNDNGDTALSLATKYENPEMVMLLLDKGAIIDERVIEQISKTTCENITAVEEITIMINGALLASQSQEICNLDNADVSFLEENPLAGDCPELLDEEL